MDVSISSAERRGDGPLVTWGDSLEGLLTITNNLFNRRHRTGRVERVWRRRARKVLLRSGLRRFDSWPELSCRALSWPVTLLKTWPLPDEVNVQLCECFHVKRTNLNSFSQFKVCSCGLPSPNSLTYFCTKIKNCL